MTRLLVGRFQPLHEGQARLAETPLREATNLPIAAQPTAFRTTDECHCFTHPAAFPNHLVTIQDPRRGFVEFGGIAKAGDIRYVGGWHGCKTAVICALADGLAEAG